MRPKRSIAAPGDGLDLLALADVGLDGDGLALVRR